MKIRIRALAGDDSAVAYDNELLTPEESLKLRNHSPTGFAWGYMGSGPAQLALAILYRHTGNAEVSLKHYQDFKREVIAGWVTTEDVDIELDIDAWIAEHD